MNRYIRTKDGYIIEVIKNKTIFSGDIIVEVEYVSDGEKTIYKRDSEENILKSANTIEELCDEFILYDNKNEVRYFISPYFSNKEYWFNYDDRGVFTPEKIKSSDIIYGAIWTEWGLKYVAKLNEKGELELL